MSAIMSPSHRKFYSLPENPHRVLKNKFSGVNKKREDLIKLVKHIDESIIGKNATFTGPYGRRKVVYCDFESSGRSLQFVEDYIVKEVLPHCGNATTTANTLSLQSILFRHEAKEIFRICVNASEADTVVFAGLGCGGPMSPLLQVLRSHWRKPPIVFVGPCERTSTILAWKELGAKVIKISESKEGFLDLNDLENQLMANRRSGGQLIGCFSAANNVTGILADDVATTLLLHQYGALAFWDYSTAAPSVQLDMNPTLAGVEETVVHKDAMFFSCHKFIGGIQTPGVLVAKKFLFKDFFHLGHLTNIDKSDQQEIDVESDLERGSVTVVEDVRGGLVMHLKEAVGIPAIMSREEKITRTVLAHVKNIPELILLGSTSHNLKRLPIFSFVVRHPRGMFLHHNFVCSVLNDVFGIQAQCSTADGDAHSLDFMGIDTILAEKYEDVLSGSPNGVLKKCMAGSPDLEALRPGFTKISFSFCISDGELGFILEALKMVATEGWKLLPQYILKSNTGEWRHHSNSIFRDRKWLGSLKYIEGKLVVPERKISTQGTCPLDFEECLHVARCIFNKARKIAQRYPLGAQKFSFDADVEPLRWFMLPNEAHNLLIGNSQNVRHKVPFDPARFKGCKGDPVQTGKNADRKGFEGVKEKNERPVQTNEILFREGDCILEKLKQELQTSSTFSSQSTSERLNSFSSETSNSDFLEPSSHSRCLGNFAPCGSIQSSISCTPAAVPFEPFCISPQPFASTPVISTVDVHSSQVHGQHRCFGGGQQNQRNQLDVRGCTRPSTNYDALDGSPASKLDVQHPMNKVHFLLGKNEIYTRQRCNSLGSSLVLHTRSRGNSGFSCRSLTDGETSLNLSECSLSSNEDIHAYVTEVTKELATEIKSEIREVISKVEDVLSDSVEVDANALNAPSKCEKLERTNSLPSASANDIAQYLMGVSKEMAEEMKSEIRGLVNSVVSPDSSPMLNKNTKKVIIDLQSKEKREKTRKKEGEVNGNENISQSRDSGINLSYTDARIESKAKGKGFVHGENCGKKEKENEMPGRKSNAETTEYCEESERNSRFRSESLDSLQENQDCDAASAATTAPTVAANPISRRKISRSLKKVEKFNAKNRTSGESSNDEALNFGEVAKARWCPLTKAVWKPTVEALKEFDMIRNGDKVLVSMSQENNSLAVLHALQQYKSYASSRGIYFELGAITLMAKHNASVKSMTTYLEALGIPHYCEEGMESDIGDPELNATCPIVENIKRERLFEAARKRDFNVVALGQNLDDFAEHFLLSVFHNGKLTSMRAHYYLPEKDVRVIRPFVYVRERALKQFVESRNWSTVPDNCTTCGSTSKERQSSRQLLSHQESIFPHLFTSLKLAMHPLMSRSWMDGDQNPDFGLSDSDDSAQI